MDVSVIIELDNARRTGVAAAQDMLRTLGAQLAEVPRRYEVVLVHDPSCMSRAAVDQVTAGARLAALVPGLEVVVVAAPPGTRYYELKNLGARHARGETLLFGDADVKPDPGFVKALLGAIADPAVRVVTGTCYVAPTDTVQRKAMGLVWQFAPCPDEDRLRPSRSFYAHSLTIARELFLEHPFRDDGRLRGACQDLRRELEQAGIPTWQHMAARVRHPPPEGWGMLRRALWDGHDICVDRRRVGQPVAPPAQAARGLGQSLSRSFHRILDGRQKVGARLQDLPAILAIAVFWQGAVRAGYLLTRASPRLIPTLLPR